MRTTNAGAPNTSVVAHSDVLTLLALNIKHAGIQGKKTVGRTSACFSQKARRPGWIPTETAGPPFCTAEDGAIK